MATEDLLLTALADAPRIDRIEPPSWCAGMKSDRLQLLVHGHGIGAAEVVSGHAAVRVLMRHRFDSPDDLFVDLQLGPGAPARAPLVLRVTRQAGNRSAQAAAISR